MGFPDGIQFGYYYNYCGKSFWRDSLGRSDITVCCKDGVYQSCDEAFAELEEKEAEEAKQEAEASKQAASKPSKGTLKDEQGSSTSSKKPGEQSTNDDRITF